MFFSSRVDYFGLFGIHLIKPSDKTVILTSCEFDAMIIHQETEHVVLALPKYISTLPQQVRQMQINLNLLILIDRY